MEAPPNEPSEIVILKIEENCLKCNRSVLINNSDYFRAMFEGNFVESNKNTITINDVDIDAMTVILKLLWDIEYEIDDSLILSVLQASSMLQFLSIKTKCITQLQDCLNESTSLRIWFFTEPLDIKELYLKAKAISLIKFMTIKNSDYFLELNLNELITYIGNVNLQCSNEIHVFRSILKWYEKTDNKSVEIAYKLLHCIDYSSLDSSELGDMIQLANKHFDENIVNILKCINHQKLNSSLECFDDICIKQAASLLKSKGRNLDGYPCVLFDNLGVDASVANTVCYQDKFKRKRKLNVLTDAAGSDMCFGYFEQNTFKLKKLLDVMHQRYVNLDGFRIVGHKDRVYMYGGEFLLGKGDWNSVVFCYSLTKNVEIPSPQLPYARRHFETCVCDNYLYIIGGTGPFRVIQENLFWFSFRDANWSKEQKLPCSGRQIKCCDFNDHLFLLNINNRCGYFYSHEDGTWTKYDICDNDNVLPFYSQTLCLFSYKNSLFIKEKKLLELKIEGDRLVIVKQVDLPEQPNGIYQTEVVLCDKILYSLNKQRCDETNQETIFFEAFNIETMETFYRFEKNMQDFIEIDGELWRFRPSLNIFSAFYPDAVIGNDIINDALY